MSDSHPSRARQVARAARHTPDRLLHARRRRIARRLVSEAGPGSYLVLCHGNICRSPYAEAALRRELARVGISRSVESAGFILPGRPPPLTALEVSAARGVDLSDHRSRAVTEEMARAAALIVVMEGWQRRELLSRAPQTGSPVILLGDLDPAPIDRRAIQDPIDRPREVFERVFDRIDACCVELVARATDSTLSTTGSEPSRTA